MARRTSRKAKADLVKASTWIGFALIAAFCLCFYLALRWQERTIAAINPRDPVKEAKEAAALRAHAESTAVRKVVSAESIARVRGPGRALDSAVGKVWTPFTPETGKRLEVLVSLLGPYRAQLAGKQRVAARRAYGRTLENALLDSGVEVTVEIDGDSAQHLSIRYAIAGKVLARKMEKNVALWNEWCRLDFSTAELVSYGFSRRWPVTCPHIPPA